MTNNIPDNTEKVNSSPWLYHGELLKEEDINGYESFVYIITHIPTGRKYLGKKYFKFKRKVKKTGRRKTIDSDWKTYWSSSEEVKNLVKSEGEQNFTREIIALCKLRAAANFLETKLLFEYKVLESDDWFNNNILGKYFSERTQKYLREDIVF